jgi:uncharacterized membrane protein
MKTARTFFDQQEQTLLIGAIALAELKTSGEIRLHIDNFCFGNEIKRAEKVFTKLKMHETKERNGVLIYIAVLSKKIAVVGDEGIHQKLSNEFWQKIVDDLIKKFKASNKAKALSECIHDCGEQLGKFFPRKSDDTNELTNTISF